MKIRPVQKSDFDEVVALLERTGLAGSYFNKKRFIGLLRRNKGFLFVAEINKKIVGSIFASHDGGYYGYIYKLAVIPEFRKQKIATQLVRTVLTKFKKQGIEWIFLHVNKDNLPSIRLFKTLGFGIRHTHYLMDNQVK